MYSVTKMKRFIILISVVIAKGLDLVSVEGLNMVLLCVS